MASECESEREALATIFDLQLALEDEAAAQGKHEFTLEEMILFLKNYARKRKIHK